jgi:methionyl aminopeptidase
VISLDVGVRLQGYHADAALTVGVGEVSRTTERLLSATRAALWEGIEQVRPGGRLLEVSAAIQKAVEARGYSVVRELCGHGVGRSLHEGPEIPNYVDRDHVQENPVLREGMTLAIEPMVSSGRPETETLADHWTVITSDRSPAAHFEHTVAVTREGARILTAGPSGEPLW